MCAVPKEKVLSISYKIVFYSYKSYCFIIADFFHSTMDFKLAEPCRRSKTGKKEENEIREIFYEHWEKMKSQTEAVMNDINAWRLRTNNEINAYADEQIRKLQTIYSRQRAIFDQEREEKISIAKNFHQSKSNYPSTVDDTFNELCKTWRSLEFQVAQLEHSQYQIPRPRVIAIGDQTQGNKQNQSNTHTHGFEDRRVKSTINETNVSEKDRDNNSRSSVQSRSNETG